MHLNDHDPPHIHAEYAEFDVRVSLNPIEVTRGHFPSRKRRQLLAWIRKRNPELHEAWDRIRNNQSAGRIEP